MTDGAWLDRDGRPDGNAMGDKLGERARSRWQAMAAWVRDTYGLEGEPFWDGHDAGWVLRYRRAGKSLITMAPSTGDDFDALVVVGPSTWAAITGMNLTDATLATFRNAHPYPGGRWLRLCVTDEASAADVRRLVTLKSPPPRRPRARVGIVAGDHAAR